MSRRKLMIITAAAGIAGMIPGCGIFNGSDKTADDSSKAISKNPGIADETTYDASGKENTSLKPIESTKVSEDNPAEDQTTAVVKESDTTGSNIENNNTTDYKFNNEYETNSNGEISYSARVNFDNAAFLGDSRTAGLDEKLVVGQADFYTSVGIDVRGALQKNLFTLSNGQKGNMLQAVSEKKYDKIYLMFGINELGWPYKETFVQYYTTIVETLKQSFPNAEIYVQSIIPMVEKRTDNVYNNEKIRQFNTYIKEVAENTGVNWVDVTIPVRDAAGALPEEASSDGIHLSRDYLFRWADYLKRQTYK